MVNCLDILWWISLWIIAIFYRSSQYELSRYFVGNFTVNYLDILWGISLWIIPIFCGEFYCELSRYFVGHLMVNYLDILSRNSLWIIELSRYFVSRPRVNYLRILWGNSLWIVSIFRLASHDKLSGYAIGRLAVTISFQFTDNRLCVIRAIENTFKQYIDLFLKHDYTVLLLSQ